jgi:hypothetical protein
MLIRVAEVVAAWGNDGENGQRRVLDGQYERWVEDGHGHWRVRRVDLMISIVLDPKAAEAAGLPGGQNFFVGGAISGMTDTVGNNFAGDKSIAVLGRILDDGTYKLVIATHPIILQCYIDPNPDPKTKFLRGAYGTHESIYKLFGMKTDFLHKMNSADRASDLLSVPHIGDAALVGGLSFMPMDVNYDQMTNKDRFSLLLHTLKWACIARSQETTKAFGNDFVPAVEVTEMRQMMISHMIKMEQIFNDSIEHLMVKMSRCPARFREIMPPMNEVLGVGNAYVGLLYSEHKTLMMTMATGLSKALDYMRDELNGGGFKFAEDGAKQGDWQSKSVPSIYTKLTDYQTEGAPPSLVRTSGIMGIKDQLRTRLIVPDSADALAVAKRMFAWFNERLAEGGDDNAGFQEITHKNKSKRFASVGGQAIYSTGYIAFPADTEVLGRVGCVQSKLLYERERDRSRFAVPFEVQVLNEAAMGFINKNHGSYELLRMLDRVSVVCDCSRDENGDLLPQLECKACLERCKKVEGGAGFCAFCHICHVCNRQQKDCVCGK